MRKALLVGINLYGGPNQLQGCVNDIMSAHRLLNEQYSWLPTDTINVITDAQATTANILTGLKWLVSNVKAGDQILFWYSGHGSQLIDGNSATDCICPVDFRFTANTSIGAQQFHDIFSTLPPGVLANWVSDSCHSGALEGDTSKGFKHIPKCIINPDIGANKQSYFNVKSFKNVELEIGYIAGCGSSETSCDAYIGGAHCGALSYYLINNIKNMGEQSIDAITEQTRQDLISNNYSQTPCCSGNRTNLPFLG